MNLIESVKSFQQKKILVIGDVMLDNYYFGSSTRISPEAPVPVLLGKNDRKVLGGAANVALNLIGAGLKASLMSVIGDDDAGKDILTMSENAGINTAYLLKDRSRITTVKNRFIAQNNIQMFRFDQEDDCCLSTETDEKLLKMFKEAIDDHDLIILSDYRKGLLNDDNTRCLINLAKEKDKRVLVDVKGDNPHKYQNAFLLKPNINELADLTKRPVRNDEEIVSAARKLLKESGAEYILATRGKDGMILVGNERYHDIECLSREVYDVTGAGDTVMAYLAAGLANGIDILDASMICSYAAGVKVARMGTYAVTTNDLIAYIADSNAVSDDNKVIGLTALEEILKTRGNKKIVFTNGCFDIFHVGHLRYLKQSAKYGDMLIVAINSDASVKRIKGNDRPIVNQNDRAELLASLNFVSYVVIFDEDTPYEIIKRLQPDIITKGGDYDPDDVVGKDIVEKRGGKVIICPLIENRSTTDIIQKVLEVYHE